MLLLEGPTLTMTSQRMAAWDVLLMAYLHFDLGTKLCSSYAGVDINFFAETQTGYLKDRRANRTNTSLELPEAVTCQVGKSLDGRILKAVPRHHCYLPSSHLHKEFMMLQPQPPPTTHRLSLSRHALHQTGGTIASSGVGCWRGRCVSDSMIPGLIGPTQGPSRSPTTAAAHHVTNLSCGQCMQTG
jgi:hypothetical protein